MTLSQYLLELPRPLFGKPSKRLYDKLQAQDFPHIHEELIRQLEELLELPFVSLSGSGNLCFIQSDEILPEFRTSFHQLHLLDAIYASSLQTNFSNIASGLFPVHSEPDTFWKLTEYGRELRLLHSLSFESFEINTPFLRSPDSIKAGRIKSDFPVFQENDETETGSIWINSNECFTEVPQAAWELRVHGQQPAREASVLLQDSHLRPEHIKEYQKCLYALKESLRPIKAITDAL